MKSLNPQIIQFFIQGIRIKTLSAILIPIAGASAWVLYKTNSLDINILLFTLTSAVFIQFAANLFNDALDHDSNSRKGPDRLVQTKKMSSGTVQFLGLLCCLIAIIAGVPLILKGGWPILVLGLLSCLLAYIYTAGPYSLLKKGLSEVFVFLFFGPVATIGTYYLQTLKWEWQMFHLGIQCGLWAMTLLLINHLRDEEEDRTEERKHFVTLYGRINSLFFLFVSQAAIYLLCFFWLGENLKSGALSFFVLPFSVGVLYLLSTTPPSKKYNSYLAFCSLFYVLFGALWIIGLFI